MDAALFLLDKNQLINVSLLGIFVNVVLDFPDSIIPGSTMMRLIISASNIEFETVQLPAGNQQTIDPDVFAQKL